MSNIIYFLKCIQSIFESFSGSGYMFVVLMVVLAVFSVCVRDELIRTVMYRYPLYVVLVFFCPLWWGYIYFVHDEEILYRLWWMLPFGLVICYALVEGISRFKGKMKALSFAVACMVIVLSGKNIFANEIFTRAENLYHVPNTVIEICDEIIVEGREISCCFPDEMISSVRQYTSFVCMPYGRGILFDWLASDDDLRSIMNNEVLDTEKACAKLRELDIAYVVVATSKSMTDSFSKYGYIYVTTIDEYDIYLDNEAYTGLDF